MGPLRVRFANTFGALILKGIGYGIDRAATSQRGNAIGPAYCDRRSQLRLRSLFLPWQAVPTIVRPVLARLLGFSLHAIHRNSAEGRLVDRADVRG